MSITNLFTYKLNKLIEKRNAAMNVNALQAAINYTDEILELCSAEKNLRLRKYDN